MLYFSMYLFRAWITCLDQSTRDISNTVRDLGTVIIDLNPVQTRTTAGQKTVGLEKDEFFITWLKFYRLLK